LDQFDFGFQPSANERGMNELKTLGFVARSENVIFLGPPGVGNYGKFFVIERFLMNT
jgi:DNA replication protein DnaC